MSSALESDLVAGGVTFPDAALAGRLREGLTRVEQRLAEECRSDDPLLQLTAPHLASAGGKRFRPLVALLSAQFGSYPAADVDAAAVVVELTHLATLYHDDVMDEAQVRRGVVSVNARWGNSVAILSGDFLFAQASALVAGLGPEAVRIQAETFRRLVVGQIRETSGPLPDEDPIDHHLDVLHGKTASLISTSGLFGALFAGCAPEVVTACRDYAGAAGMAFQLSDDIIDITSDSAALGKRSGADLREGIRTLPILSALADPDTDPELLRLLSAGALPDEADHARAVELMRRSAGLDRARDVMTDYLDQARDALERLPDGPACDAMYTVAGYLASRTA